MPDSISQKHTAAPKYSAKEDAKEEHGQRK